MFTIKFLIAAAIVGISAMIGIRKSKKYETREHILRESATMFKSLENEIKYMLNCVPDAIENIRHGMSTTLKNVLGVISVDMLTSPSIDINKRICSNVEGIYELTSYDKEVISSGLSSLGKGDVDSQVGIINNTISILENQIEEATNEKYKNSKMYRTLGVAIGLAIAIVFI